ncbi:sensor histidine kinase [Flavobacterium sp.]|jgi:two-component system phosphate regulon sensor histidine kinase PhoR|uniref:sensor histidine kinase n=1 Tax=Flavobacterium sp. TaxID=239 RepID=UPI0037BF6F64
MKLNTKKIVAFITGIILFTICLQVYWNYKNYQSNEVRLKNEIQIAFDKSLELYFDEASKDKFITVFSSDSTIQIEDFMNKIKTDSIFGKKLKREKKTPKANNHFTHLSFNYNDIKDKKTRKASVVSPKIDTLVLSKKTSPKYNLDSFRINTPNIKLSAIKIERDSSKNYSFTKNAKAIKQSDSLIVSDKFIIAKKDKKDNIIVLKGKKAMDSIQKNKKYRNKISMTFVNDTIKYKTLDSIFQSDLKRKSIVLTYEFSHFKNDALFFTYLKSKNKLPFQIKPNSTYFKPKETVYLNYNYSKSIIINRMGVELILSLLFSLAVVSCLFFLLIIIKKQKKIDEIKNDFINNITHEFKTPITTIGSALEGMSNFNPDNDLVKNKKYIDISFIQLQKLEKMVEKILETAILNVKEIKLNKEQINMVSFIKSITEKHLMTSNKSISFHFQDNVMLYNADPFYLENAISNLIDNAIKYGGDIIDISCFNSEKLLIIEIKDNGNTITKADENQIFEKFYRIPKGNLHDVKGYGIGLYYTKTILEMHKGKIDLIRTNETNFRIALPNE